MTSSIRSRKLTVRPGFGSSSLRDRVQNPVLLDLAVAAVMVGEEQAVARDHLTGAAGAEQHHGVLERRLVDAVHILRREAETVRLHVVDALGDQHRQPHPFVSPQGLESGRQGERRQYYVFLHIQSVICLSLRERRSS